jgi:hypothetical protein
MPRHRTRDRDPFRLRLPETRMLGAAITLIATPAIAMAEVCDKIAGEHWSQSDGVVVWKTSTIDWSWAAPPTLLLLAVAAVLATIPAILKSSSASKHMSFVISVYLKWVTYAVAAMVTLAVVFVLYSFIVPDDVLVGGIKEGCVSLTTDLKPVGVGALVVVLFGWAALRLRRFERVAEAQYRGLVAG